MNKKSICGGIVVVFIILFVIGSMMGGGSTDSNATVDTQTSNSVDDPTNDLRDDFIFTSREGFAHANDISAYSFVAVARIADELDMLNEGASLVSLTYYGSTKVLPGYNVMGVAKAALETSVRYLADNLGKKNVRVNAVSAGPIKTLSAKGIKDFGSILDVVEEKAPLHRNVTTKDVGDATAFLFSNLSNAITGEIIHVDNGFSCVGV